MKLPIRNLAILAHDMAAAALAWALAYWLRFNFEIPSQYFFGMLSSLFWVVPLHAVVFFAYGVNRGLWRYVSLKDIQRIVLAVALAAPSAGRPADHLSGFCFAVSITSLSLPCGKPGEITISKGACPTRATKEKSVSGS